MADRPSAARLAELRAWVADPFALCPRRSEALEELVAELDALKAELAGPYFCACGDELHCYGCDTAALVKSSGYVRAEIKKVAEIKGRGFVCDIDIEPPLVVGDSVWKSGKSGKRWTVMGVERYPFRGLLLRCESAPLALLEEGPCEVARKP